MDRINSFFCRAFRFTENKIQKYYNRLKTSTIKLGLKEEGVYIGFPSFITNPSKVYLHKNSTLGKFHKIINYTGSFIIKENTAVSQSLTVVTGNHIPTVGIPQSILAPSHINDKETDIIVEEDVWIGINVTLIAGAHVNRGVIIGACSLVNKNIPPYAIVAGCPAKIIGVKFSIEQIIKHEKLLYPKEKRFSHEYIEQLFQTYYSNVKPLGIDNLLNKDQQQYLESIIYKWKFNYKIYRTEIDSNDIK